MPDEELGGAYVNIGGKLDPLKKDLATAEGMVKASMASAARMASQFATPVGRAVLGAGAVGAGAGIAAKSLSMLGGALRNRPNTL
jgi:uncharacterized protein YaaW (UPF0174 family)